MSSPELHPAAEQELAEVLAWYKEKRTGLGQRFYEAIETTMIRIGRTPELYAPWKDNPRYRRAILEDFPYAIFYRSVQNHTVVIAVAHTSRRPGYWLDRRVP